MCTSVLVPRVFLKARDQSFSRVIADVWTLIRSIKYRLITK